MRKPTNVGQMRKLAGAISNVIWYKIVVAHNGDVNNAEIVDEEYRQELCKLSSNDLKFILLCDRKKIFRRDPQTIDAITSELFEREILRKPNVRASKSRSKRSRRKT